MQVQRPLLVQHLPHPHVRHAVALAELRVRPASRAKATRLADIPLGRRLSKRANGTADVAVALAAQQVAIAECEMPKRRARSICMTPPAEYSRRALRTCTGVRWRLPAIASS